MQLAHLTRSLMLALAVAAACSDGQSPQAPILLSDLDGGPLFLVQSEPATAVMEALFDGPVLLDAAGCLRLDLGSSESATVVRPFGATLEALDGTYRVRDGDGRAVGTVGERFRLRGGFISDLHDGIPLNQDARARAHAQCPGTYWIVGELP